MPFTPAHPAILLPFRSFKKLKLSWTALIIGSIVPDLEYFVWLSPSAYISHTLTGIFLFNLPMTVILAFAWNGILFPVIRPRINCIKSSVTLEYYPKFHEWMARNWVMFFTSAIVGILSHLVWDSFCHANGYMVHRIPYLLNTEHIWKYDIRRCYLLWYASTIIGGIIMLLWFIDLKKVFSATTWKIFFQGSAIWLKILIVAGIICATRIAMGLSWNWTRHLVIIVLGGLFYSTMLVCWWELRQIRRKLWQKAGMQ